MKSVSATDTLIPVPKDGKDAVLVTVSPETVLFKKSTSVQTAAVRVTVTDGDTEVKNTDFACSVPSALTQIDESLAWYSVKSGQNAIDVSVMAAAGSTPGRALSFSVTYGGKTENRKITVRTVSDGDPGADAVRYWLKGSVTQVVRDALGNCTPATVSCTALCQKGNGAATAASGVTMKYSRPLKNLAALSVSYAAGDLITVGSAQAVNFYLYRNDALIDTLTIPVVEDGKPGERGRNGRLPVPYGEYDPAISYTATDLVAPFVLQEGEYYVMNKSVTVKGVSPKEDYAANGTDATWLHMEFFRAVYAELLMARLGLIGKAVFYDEFMFSQYGKKNGSEVNYNGGYDIPTDAGGSFDPNIVINFLTGALRCRKADITGNINASSGKIAGFNISGNSLTNGPEFTNDACVIFRNDTYRTFAGIGGNVLPATTGMRAVARFENEDINNLWGLGRNIAMLLSAKNGDINHAFMGSGNGNLDGWIGGYKYSRFQINASNTIYSGHLNLRENNRWFVYSSSKDSGVTLPTLNEVRTALGIDSKTPFCVEFTVIADLLTQYNYRVYGRTKMDITVNGEKTKPYWNGEYPVITHWNGGRFENVEMGAGDSLMLLLVYDPNKSGVLDTDYQLKYTARIINLQQ